MGLGFCGLRARVISVSVTPKPTSFYVCHLMYTVQPCIIYGYCANCTPSCREAQPRKCLLKQNELDRYITRREPCSRTALFKGCLHGYSANCAPGCSCSKLCDLKLHYQQGAVQEHCSFYTTVSIVTVSTVHLAKAAARCSLINAH